VQATAFDELAFFRAIADSGARALLIGRQALIALGMPVMTSDDLISTKRFGARPRDADDIRWLQRLRDQR
jgi:hypothetical protein